jgi:hypothetical protein
MNTARLAMLAREGLFDWGLAPPLEMVIETPDHPRALLSMPEIYRQSVSVIEPWRDVGTNPRSEPVRASKNVAYVCQQVADADTILYPVWRSGIEDPERLANVLSAGIATVVQGGNPSVHDASSFHGGRASLDDPLALVDQLLLRRSTASGPTIFICLGHQLAAASHIWLVKRAVRELQALTRLDPGGRALATLQRVCGDIGAVGESLAIVKRGEVIARLERPALRGGAERERGGRYPPTGALRSARRTTPRPGTAARDARPRRLRTRGCDRRRDVDRARARRRDLPRRRGQRGGCALRQLGLQVFARRNHSSAPLDRRVPASSTPSSWPTSATSAGARACAITNSRKATASGSSSGCCTKGCRNET